MGRALLLALVHALETDPTLAERLRTAIVLPGHPDPTPQADTYMKVTEYAARARVSAKTIRHHVQHGMVEGEHYLREGRTGRRIVIDVRKADAWRAARRSAPTERRSLEDFATNDLLRRRAQIALKKRGVAR
jgi:hypothetical protein